MQGQLWQALAHSIGKDLCNYSASYQRGQCKFISLRVFTTIYLNCHGSRHLSCSTNYDNPCYKVVCIFIQISSSHICIAITIYSSQKVAKSTSVWPKTSHWFFLRRQVLLQPRIMQMKVVMVERYVSSLHSFLLHKSLTTWISHVWNFWSNPVASALGFLIWCWNRTSFYWSRVYFNLTSMSIVHSLDARPCAPPSSLGRVQRSPRGLHGLWRALPQHEPERRLHGARQERCQARHSDCFRGGWVSCRCTGGVNMSKKTSQGDVQREIMRMKGLFPLLNPSLNPPLNPSLNPLWIQVSTNFYRQWGQQGGLQCTCQPSSHRSPNPMSQTPLCLSFRGSTGKHWDIRDEWKYIKSRTPHLDPLANDRLALFKNMHFQKIIKVV